MTMPFATLTASTGSATLTASAGAGMTGILDEAGRVILDEAGLVILSENGS